MRTLTVLGSVLLFTAFAFGQAPGPAQNGPTQSGPAQMGPGQNWRGIPGFCPYGCAPYVPMLTTPMLSFATVSPNPVGATDATGGLVTGATDSTLSEVNGEAGSVYTVPVWYAGGETPVIAPLGRRMNGVARPGEIRPGEKRMLRHENLLEPKKEVEPSETTTEAWIYFPSQQSAAGRTYSNADVDRMNEQNGSVKYDDKTEKIQ